MQLFSHDKITSSREKMGENNMNELKDIRNAGVSVLCKLGKLGVSKSTMFGMYNFEIPEKYRERTVENPHENERD